MKKAITLIFLLLCSILLIVLGYECVIVIIPFTDIIENEIAKFIFYILLFPSLLGLFLIGGYILIRGFIDLFK